MGYAKEFNFEDYIVPACIQTIAWKDVSWHNDVCPRFENTGLMLAVWVDCADPEKREHDDWSQYTIVGLIRLNSEETTLADDYLFQTESFNELESWLKMYEIKQLIEKAVTIGNSMEVQPEEIADGLVSTLEWLGVYMKPDTETT